MYILQPIIHETIWGGTKLKKYADNHRGNIGHLYLINGHRDMSNYILNGDMQGKKLSEVFNIYKNKWNMGKYEEFPLTIALVDAKDDLSIQVHPDDITAEKLEHKKIGKKESWLFLDAPDSGWIYGGCKCQSTEDIKESIEHNNIQNVTAKVNIKKSDYACVEAGTLHAMTKGSLVYEIEYGSDFTYRFYDYERVDSCGNRRELHIDKALCSIKTGKRPFVKHCCPSEWISEDVYEICMLTGGHRYVNTSGGIECISVLSGLAREDGVDIKGGMGLLLLPGEEIDASALDEFIVARLCDNEGDM